MWSRLWISWSTFLELPESIAVLLQLGLVLAFNLLKDEELLFFSCSVVSNSLRPHGLQHARLPCPSLSPWVYSNWCPLSWRCHPTISSSVTPSPPALSLSLRSFPMILPFASGGQSIGALASVLPMNIQDSIPLGLTGLISSKSKGLSRVFSNTTVWKHLFFSA